MTSKDFVYNGKAEETERHRLKRVKSYWTNGRGK